MGNPPYNKKEAKDNNSREVPADVEERPPQTRRFFLRRNEEVIMKNYTYILECGDGTLYTGWTNDLKKRVKRHNEGKGAKYTRSRLPVKLVYQESFDTKQEAMKWEAQIKKLTRKKKLLLIDTYQQKLKYTKGN